MAGVFLHWIILINTLTHIKTTRQFIKASSTLNVSLQNDIDSKEFKSMEWFCVDKIDYPIRNDDSAYTMEQLPIRLFYGKD